MKTKALHGRHHRRDSFSFLIAATAVGLVSAYAPASLGVEPAIFMQSATISGAGNALTLGRVPVKDANGKITYKDISMLFTVDNAGNVTLDPQSVSITSSPPLNAGTFKPGHYRGYKACNEADCKGDFTVGTGGGNGGRISGSIQRINIFQGAGSADISDVFNASWTSGPINGHPDEAKLKAAGITSTAYSWGVMGTAGAFTKGSGWRAGDIIGAIQTGNQLTLVNFGDDNKSDASLTFDLCPADKPC
jgi:hypothetical protein